MNAQKLRGRERRNSAKIFLIVALFIFLIFLPLKADTIWTEGYHEINDGDVYTEIWMYNDATVDILDGEIFKLEAFDMTGVVMFDGQMDLLFTHNDSTINIHGGHLGALASIENSSVYLYAYDVVHHPTGGHYDGGWVEGNYLDNGLYFSFDLGALETFSHITVIPEPSTILLLSLGGLLVRRRY
jgi:hypothetical protein